MENTKELLFMTYLMTKEKFESIPDNLMIRKLLLDYEYEQESNYDTSFTGFQQAAAMSRSKSIIILGGICLILAIVILVVILVVIHSIAS
mmetsp:Transcript_42979/g.50413  ORF Transcript_42979/g.50413 Transcript_42979/m.50413 type:complete len:90 (-) Transcript_42979:40-309(-)